MRGKNTQINITLTQIRALMATAENKSFAKAAETLFVSQPTVSYQIKILENELGVQLFARDAHSVELTPAGLMFYSSITGLYEKTIQLVRDVQQLDSHSAQTLNIGVHAAFCSYPCAIVAHFNEMTPEIKTSVRSLDSIPSLQALRRGEIDIQFLFRGELGVEEGIEFALLNMNRLCVNMRKSDPLAAQEIITLDDFRNRTVFIPVQISYSREIVELRRMIAKRNIPVEFVVNEDFSRGFTSVRSGEALTLFAMGDMTEPIPDIAVIPLSPPTTVEYGVAWKQDNQFPPLRAFLDYLLG